MYKTTSIGSREACDVRGYGQWHDHAIAIETNDHDVMKIGELSQSPIKSCSKRPDLEQTKQINPILSHNLGIESGESAAMGTILIRRSGFFLIFNLENKN